MRYHELMGLLDDTFAKYRKEENTPDSKWSPYCYYKNLDDVKNDYSVYVGSKGLQDYWKFKLELSYKWEKDYSGRE